jgi:hypothetical protein
MLAVATLIAVLDTIASGVSVLEGALGIVGNEAGTISKAAASNRDLLAALDDVDVQTDLTADFARRALMLTASTFYPALQGQMIARALDVHYGGTGSLNRFLTEQDSRVHPTLKKIGFQIDSRNIFSPTVLDPVARYEGTGAGTGNYVAGSDLDAALYGEAGMEVVVEVMGASARTLRFQMKTYDGAIEEKDVVIGAGAGVGTFSRIGGALDRYIGVAGISTTGGGGTAGDTFRVRSIVERNLPALP